MAKYPHLKSLQDVFARTPRRTLSDAGKVDPKTLSDAAKVDPKTLSGAAKVDPKTLSDAGKVDAKTLSDAGQVDPKGVPAAPAAAGADQDTAEVKQDKTIEEADAGNDDLEGAPAAPAAAAASEGAPAAPAAAAASKDEEVGASADTAEGPKDQGGKLLEAGAIVVMTAKKHKHLYNGFKGNIIRVNTKNVVVSILEGPAKGERRKFLFASVDVVEDAPAKKAKLAEAPAEESVAPTAAAPAAEAPAEDEQPDKQCMAMFGDLDLYA